MKKIISLMLAVTMICASIGLTAFAATTTTVEAEADGAASTKVGGTGIRYTVQICGKPTFLFDEENGKWFVEAKT